MRRPSFSLGCYSSVCQGHLTLSYYAHMLCGDVGRLCGASPLFLGLNNSQRYHRYLASNGQNISSPLQICFLYPLSLYSHAFLPQIKASLTYLVKGRPPSKRLHHVMWISFLLRVITNEFKNASSHVTGICDTTSIIIIT